MRFGSALDSVARWGRSAWAARATAAKAPLSGSTAPQPSLFKRALKLTDGPFRWLREYLPKGLYARALVIVITPVVPAAIGRSPTSSWSATGRP